MQGSRLQDSHTDHKQTNLVGIPVPSNLYTRTSTPSYPRAGRSHPSILPSPSAWARPHAVMLTLVPCRAGSAVFFCGIAVVHLQAETTQCTDARPFSSDAIDRNIPISCGHGHWGAPQMRCPAAQQEHSRETTQALVPNLSPQTQLIKTSPLAAGHGHWGAPQRRRRAAHEERRQP